MDNIVLCVQYAIYNKYMKQFSHSIELNVMSRILCCLCCCSCILELNNSKHGIGMERENGEHFYTICLHQYCNIFNTIFSPSSLTINTMRKARKRKATANSEEEKKLRRAYSQQIHKVVGKKQCSVCEQNRMKENNKNHAYYTNCVYEAHTTHNIYNSLIVTISRFNTYNTHIHLKTFHKRLI